MTDKELDKFIKPTKDLLTKAYTDKDTMLKILGASKHNPNKNYLQQALEIYPELLHDKHVQKELSETISSKKKDAKFAKVSLDAKYTFLLPDIFAWMGFSICGNKNPEGLLANGEVSCKLYKGKKELLVDRSPHLFLEHCVRNNVTDSVKSKWFTTNGIYTSCHDLISKTLQFDNDGDKSLVVGDLDIIKIAKRNMEGILPLYYEMGKADPREISNSVIWDSLKLAFKYGNIGKYSNKLTALWNAEERDLDTCKVICSLNNFSIDAAKTLVMPKLTGEIGKKVSAVNQLKLPYFFQFAKDKEVDTVAPMNNSTVNRLCAKVEEIGIHDYDFSGVGNFRSAMLMNNPKIVIVDEVVNKYDELNKVKDTWFMKATLPKEEVAPAIYARIKKELLEVCPELSIVDVVDMIIKHIYKNHRGQKKTFLFNCFGDIIVENLKNKTKKRLDDGYFQCSCCGKRIKRSNAKQTMCKPCAKKADKEKARLRVKASRSLKPAI